MINQKLMTVSASGGGPAPPPLADGLWVCGGNVWGQLGLGDSWIGTYRSSPVQVGVLTTWSKVTGGGTFSLSTKDDGGLWAWGENGYGQAGTGNRVIYSSPVQIGSLTNWSDINCGNVFSLSLKTDGTIWAWGRNNNGELAQGNVINKSSPVQIGSLTTWVKIGAGNSSAAAIKTDNTLWTWGRNDDGQLGLGDVDIHRSSPVQVGSLTDWDKISVGVDFMAAIKTDNTLWMWGHNLYGQLGLEDLEFRSSPVQIGSLTNWDKVVCGAGHTLAVKTDGTLWSWGVNNRGELGQGDLVKRSSPVQVGSLTTWDKLSATQTYSSYGIKTDGTLWSWGYNDKGQLGLLDMVNRSSPVQVGSSNTWDKVSGGGGHVLLINLGS